MDAYRSVGAALLLLAVVAGCGQGAGLVSDGNASHAAWAQSYNVRNASNKPELEHDQAWLTINTTVNFRLQLWTQSTQCWKCPLNLVKDFQGPNTTHIVVNTTSDTRVQIARKHPTLHLEEICSFQIRFSEYGDYWVFLDYQDYMEGALCNLLLTNDPLPAEMPILFAILGLLGLAGLWYLVKRLYFASRSGGWTGSANITDPSPPSSGRKKEDLEMGATPAQKTEETKKKERLKSLDTFRGLCLVVMIFVNYGGGGYWFFEHPPWNGLTVADLVFPWFIFIMGTAMNFSFRSMLKRNTTRGRMMLKVFWRSVKLFALGIFLNSSWGPVWLVQLRIPGVLQRFAFTYLLVAAMEVVFARRQDSHQDKRWAPLRDILLYLPEWLLTFALLALFLGLTYGLPVPGCPTGYVGPGGISEKGIHYNCTGGAARYVDSLILGDKHMYQFPTPKVLYMTMKPFDPEGILGILTSVFLCFLGLQSGRIIQTFETHRGRIIRWLVWGVLTGAVAALLCGGRQNDGWIPLNKNLWSVSFVLTTGSFAFFLLTFMYVIIDILHWWDGSPFIFPGMNSIVIYVLHSVFWRNLPVAFMTDNVHWKLLLMDIWGTGIWVFIAFLLFRKRIFIAL